MEYELSCLKLHAVVSSRSRLKNLPPPPRSLLILSELNNHKEIQFIICVTLLASLIEPRVIR
jgi:hypothetical protein